MRLDSTRSYAVATILAQILSLMRGVVVARLVSPAAQAEFLLVSVLVGWAGSAMATNATWQVTQSSRYRDKEFLGALIFVSVVRASVGCGLTFGIGCVVVWAFDWNANVMALLLLCLGPLVASFAPMQPWADIRDGNYHRLAISEVLQPIIALVGVALAVLLGVKEIWLLCLSFFLGMSSRAAAGFVACWRCPYTIRWSRSDLREIFSYSLPLMPAGFLGWVSSQAPRLVVAFAGAAGHATTTSGMGSFQAVSALVQSPFAPLAKILRAWLVPAIGKKSPEDREGRKQEFRRRLRQFLVFQAAVTPLASTTICLVLPRVIGAQYQDSGQIGAIMCCYVICQLFRSFVGGAALGDAKTSVVLSMQVIRLVLSISLGAALVISFGITGLLIGAIAAEITAASLGVAFLARMGLGSRLDALLSAGAMSVSAVLAISMLWALGGK